MHVCAHSHAQLFLKEGQEGNEEKKIKKKKKPRDVDSENTKTVRTDTVKRTFNQVEYYLTLEGNMIKLRIAIEV